ncbi:MAG: 8-amino-7-oxononanoate synthase [Gammaproteobacteria bacterium]|nr:8-amino-7-oxononanoate synthase [Gammaproteobacteria bacterium]
MAFDLTARLTSGLTQQKEQLLYRSRKVIDSPQGVELQCDGKPLLSFCSNDYLGLANHPALVKALKKGAERYGVGSGASHLITGHSYAHHALEEALAEFTQRPRALLFSSGYMANLGTISALSGKQDVIHEDRLNHASLMDAAKLSGATMRRYPHNDTEALNKRLEKSNHHHSFIITDAVFSMDGDIAPLPQLVKTASRHNAILMVDDAHGIGVIGKHGRGCIEHFGLNNDNVPILVGTLGKAFGTSGAFVAGSDELIETLIQRARTYIYTTALPPAIAHATLTSLKLIATEAWRREHLQTLIKRFRSGAQQLGLNLMPSTTPIQPLLIGDSCEAMYISEALQQQGILISAIRPPTVPDGTARLRIAFSANHSEQHIEQLLSVLDSVIKHDDK